MPDTYEGLRPDQQAEFDKLMTMAMGQWPDALKDYMGRQELHCGEDFAHHVGAWVRMSMP